MVTKARETLEAVNTLATRVVENLSVRERLVAVERLRNHLRVPGGSRSRPEHGPRGGAPAWRARARAEARPEEPAEPLTDTEREVLRHLSQMLTTGEIAAAMLLPVETVQALVRSVLHKLAATHRNEPVRRRRAIKPLHR